MKKLVLPIAFLAIAISSCQNKKDTTVEPGGSSTKTFNVRSLAYDLPEVVVRPKKGFDWDYFWFCFWGATISHPSIAPAPPPAPGYTNQQWSTLTRIQQYEVTFGMTTSEAAKYVSDGNYTNLATEVAPGQYRIAVGLVGSDLENSPEFVIQFTTDLTDL
jgi:hypothetical protein